MSPRRATEADLAAILALEEQSFETRHRWSERSWAGELAAENRAVLVSGEPVVGVVTVQQIAAVAELNRIVTALAHRRIGLGGELLTAGIAAAVAAEADEMLLEVREDNTPALALYARHGFREIARRVGYYGAGTDAVVMRLELEMVEGSQGDD